LLSVIMTDYSVIIPNQKSGTKYAMKSRRHKEMLERYFLFDQPVFLFTSSCLGAFV